ncbi:MAG: hypothetical protein ACPGU1_22355 [Myxococcota bacterium]
MAGRTGWGATLRQHLAVLLIASGCCLMGCEKPLGERVVGTWVFYDAGMPRGDGLAMTIEANGTGTLSGGDGLAWVQYPNMQYITIMFADESGNMTMRLKTDDEGTLRIAGALQQLKRKGSPADKPAKL